MRAIQSQWQQEINVTKESESAIISSNRRQLDLWDKEAWDKRTWDKEAKDKWLLNFSHNYSTNREL